MLHLTFDSTNNSIVSLYLRNKLNILAYRASNPGCEFNAEYKFEMSDQLVWDFHSLSDNVWH